MNKIRHKGGFGRTEDAPKPINGWLPQVAIDHPILFEPPVPAQAGLTASLKLALQIAPTTEMKW